MLDSRPQTLRRSPGRGFTIIEIMIVLAIMALITSLVVINTDSILQGIGDPPVEETFRKTIREARYLAGKEKDIVTLRYDAEETTFHLYDANGQALATFPTGLSSDELTVEWFLIPPGAGLDLTPIGRQREIPLSEIHFHPDRSSTPFEVRFTQGRAQLRQVYDPFSISLLEEDRR